MTIFGMEQAWIVINAITARMRSIAFDPAGELE
jgi:hypothetical protein